MRNSKPEQLRRRSIRFHRYSYFKGFEKPSLLRKGNWRVSLETVFVFIILEIINMIHKVSLMTLSYLTFINASHVVKVEEFCRYCLN